jgi:hypothetical protein
LPQLILRTFFEPGKRMRRFRFTAAVLLLTQLAACHRLRIVEAPGPFVNSRMPSRIWVTPENGPELPLDAPRVVSDTLYGFSLVSGQVATFALMDLERVRARELWVGPTVGLGVVALAVVAGVSALLGGRGDALPPDDEPD